jgi:glutamine amidotransferase
MNKKITVVDYGVGNLFSVRRALESCGGGDIAVSSSAQDIVSADRLVLPGVGAFADGMQGLRQNGLDEAVLEFARSGRPLLGICLGMQMLASESEEFGVHSGLGLIRGKVVAIPTQESDGARLKVPFVGWATLVQNDSADASGSCLKDVGTTDAVYLVHSYQVQAADHSDVLATYQYGDITITAAIKRDNITGLQFHPEKSGKVGMRILANFIAG